MKKKDLRLVCGSAKILIEDFCHANQVTRLSLSLYDDLAAVHGFGRQTRRILAAAALLHDVGWGITGDSHNKCGMEFVLRDKTLPFTPRERLLVALAVRYHRGPLPKKHHLLYGDLTSRDQRVVDLLCGVLRVADGLDRSHCSAVRSAAAKFSKDAVVISCDGLGSGSLEKRTALKKADMLRIVFSSDVQICWKTVT